MVSFSMSEGAVVRSKLECGYRSSAFIIARARDSWQEVSVPIWLLAGDLSS